VLIYRPKAPKIRQLELTLQFQEFIIALFCYRIAETDPSSTLTYLYLYLSVDLIYTACWEAYHSGSFYI
jgi:hypothetical protein